MAAGFEPRPKEAGAFGASSDPGASLAAEQLPSRQTVAANGRFISAFFHTNCRAEARDSLGLAVADVVADGPAFRVGRWGIQDKAAYQLDPLSPIIGYRIGAIHFLAQRYDEAIAVLKKIANDSPTFPSAHLLLAWSYWGKGMYPQSVKELLWNKVFA